MTSNYEDLQCYVYSMCRNCFYSYSILGPDFTVGDKKVFGQSNIIININLGFNAYSKWSMTNVSEVWSPKTKPNQATLPGRFILLSLRMGCSQFSFQ